MLNRYNPAMTTNPSACLEARNQNNRSILNDNNGTVHQSRRATLMGIGRIAYSGFCAVLPPNSPNCNPNNDILGTGFGLHSASSYHTGGVTIGLFDGSVRFISETIDTKGSTATPVLSGPSAFGTWGALGAINDGSAVAL